MTSYQDGALRLYAWDVRSESGGPGGVTDDHGLAIRHVDKALRGAAPGARGLVRRVGLSPVGFARYVHLGDVGEAWRDEKTGVVIWRDA